MELEYDILVIGAGPGGLSAAKAAMQTAARSDKACSPFRVAVLERDEIPGGILNQCVHDGFGIVRYGAQLSGPEYAEIEIQKAEEAGVQILTGCMVTEIRLQEAVPAETKAGFRPGFAVTVITRSGYKVLQAKSIVLATGCRERTRGMLSIPGTRPAGIYTAGVAQNLINRKNIMVGRRVVLLGTGDIGLIMARRLTLEGAEVLCAAEVMAEPTGLARNVRQCLYDFGIPLHLRTTVSNIYGKGRLEAVELSEVDEDLQPVPGTEKRIECDTLILSVGLIPENEVAKTAGVKLDPKTGGAKTDAYLQTNIPGIFACGNARAVMDLADFVSEQGEIAGANAAIYAAYAEGGAVQPLQKWEKNPHNAALKGLPEENAVTCTLCPKGCQILAEWDPEQEKILVTGNGCPRGEAFARQELTDPHRILTTTIRSASDASAGSTVGSLIPVRSDSPVPLDEMQELAKMLRSMHIPAEHAEKVRRGDVLAAELGRDHVNIIAERSAI